MSKVNNGRAVYGVLFNNTSTITPPNSGTDWTEYDDTTVTTTEWFGTVDFRMGVGEYDLTRENTGPGQFTGSSGAGYPSNDIRALLGIRIVHPDDVTAWPGTIVATL